jgi:hypothetical protein
VEKIAVYASRRQLVRNALGCALFVVIGIWMMVSGPVLLGLAGAVLFGGVGLSFVFRLLKPKPMFELTPDGLRPWPGGLVPWQQVEDVGVGSVIRVDDVIGVRLFDYTAYILSVPRKLPLAYLFGIWTTGLSMGRAGQPDIPGLTRRQRHHVALLAWSRRRTGGLDLYWQHRMIAEPPESLVSQILAYRANALNV